MNVSSGFVDIDDTPGARLPRARCAVAGVASRGVGGPRLRRQAHNRLVGRVSDSLSSSHHVDHVHTRSAGCAHGVHDVSSLVDMHDARTNSWGVLDSAYDNQVHM